MVEVLQPRQTVDQSGNPVYASAHSDPGLISLRTTAVVANAQTIANDNTTDFESGKIPLMGCPVIYLYIDFTKGSLTTATITPRFGWGTDTDYLSAVAAAPSSGVITVSDTLAFLFAATAKLIIPVLNPGAEYVQFYTSSAGTTTSSDMLVSVMRGFNNHVGYVA